MRVLLTGVGGGGAVSIIEALRPHFIVGVDADPTAAGKHFVDKFYGVPLASDAEFVAKLLNICRVEKIDVAIISVDEELGKLAWLSDVFKPTILSITEPMETLTCLHKLKFHQRVDGYFNVPQIVPKVIRKPVMGRGSVGIETFENKPEHIMQEFIDGDEYTVDVLRNQDGSFAAVVPRLRVSTSSGLSVKGKTVRDGGLVAATEKVIEHLGLWGAANVQWIISDEPYLIEVNPRLAGSVALSVAAGANIPAGLVEVLSGNRVEPMEFTEITMIRYYKEIFKGE